MDDDQQFCLRWNNHQSTLISVFDTLLENGTLVDCTLAAEGKFLKAHKVVLCACSPYFAVRIILFILQNSNLVRFRLILRISQHNHHNIDLILIQFSIFLSQYTVTVIAAIRQTSHFHT